MRGGIADILGVGQGNLGFAHEVDEHFGCLFVARALGDAHGVHKAVGALGGQEDGQVRVIFHHGHAVAGVIRRQRGLAAAHFVEHLVHHIALHHALLLFQLLRGVLYVGKALRVQRAAQHFARNGKGVAAVVEHEDVVGILFVPQNAPALR